MPLQIYQRLYGIHPTSTTFSLHNYYNQGGLFVFYSDQQESIICAGDSGSPIIKVKDENISVVGLVSSTVDFRCGGQRDNTALATNVYDHLDWIKSVLDGELYYYPKHSLN